MKIDKKYQDKNNEIFGKPESLRIKKKHQNFTLQLSAYDNKLNKIEKTAETLYYNDSEKVKFLDNMLNYLAKMGLSHNPYEFDYAFKQNLKLLVDAPLNQFIEKRDAERVMNRLKELNLIPENIFKKAIVQKTQDGEQSPNALVVVTPAAVYTIGALIANAVVAVNLGLAVNVVAYAGLKVRTKGVKTSFSNGSEELSQIYPQLFKILNEISSLSNKKFATSVEKVIAADAVKQIKEALQIVTTDKSLNSLPGKLS